jgi:hypothetical protein
MSTCGTYLTNCSARPVSGIDPKAEVDDHAVYWVLTLAAALFSGLLTQSMVASAAARGLFIGDDYAAWPDVKRAIDDFLAKTLCQQFQVSGIKCAAIKA